MSPEVVIIRHPKERLSKCSLQPLVGREGFTFYKGKEGFSFDATGYTLLALDAPVLSEKDAGRPLLLLDSTWRLLPQLEACVTGEPVKRTLPAVQTAYPRVSKIDRDPTQGLASVEALYLALKLIGHNDESLLNQYHWKTQFLDNIHALSL